MAIKNIVKIWDGKNLLEENVNFLKLKTKKVTFPASDFIKDINRWKVIEVKSIMQKGSSKGASLDSSCSLEDALKVLNNEKNNECSVVDGKGKKIGKS